MITKYQKSCSVEIKANSNKVWSALTNPEIVSQYFFGANQQSDFLVGSPITWEGEFQGRKYLDKGVIIECDPYRKLIYSYLSSWSGMEDIPENYLMVKYELLSKHENTLFTITFSNYDEKRAEHSLQNWQYLADALKKVVELN